MVLESEFPATVESRSHDVGEGAVMTQPSFGVYLSFVAPLPAILSVFYMELVSSTQRLTGRTIFGKIWQFLVTTFSAALGLCYLFPVEISARPCTIQRIGSQPRAESDDLLVQLQFFSPVLGGR